MDIQTKIKLNDLNKKFYQRNAKSFSDTRQYWWAGWKKLAEYFEKLEFNPTTVLDVGSGNGRFGKFIKSIYPEISYTGADFSEELLTNSNKNLGKLVGVDITDRKELAKLGKYDLIVLMAVLHHIPGKDQRKELIQELYRHLNPQGIMVLTFWQFLSDSNLSDKVIPWESIGIEEEVVESGDRLLTWNNEKDNLRYCHNFTDLEQADYLQNLKVIANFRADGKTGQLNTYFLLQKP